MFVVRVCVCVFQLLSVIACVCFIVFCVCFAACVNVLCRFMCFASDNCVYNVNTYIEKENELQLVKHKCINQICNTSIINVAHIHIYNLISRFNSNIII